MKRFGMFVGVLAAFALLGPDATAQRQRPQQPQQKRGQGFGGFGAGGFGGRDLVSLLAQKSVQAELKMSEDQVKQVAALNTGARGTFQRGQNLSREELQKRAEERAKATAKTEKELASILKPDQLKRAKQITLQQRGAQALADAEVATALGLTAEQKDKIREIQGQGRQGFAQGFQRGAGGNFEELRKKMEAARKQNEEKLLALLTTEQKTKWKELTGAPFTGEITRGTRRPPN